MGGKLDYLLLGEGHQLEKELLQEGHQLSGEEEPARGGNRFQIAFEECNERKLPPNLHLGGFIGHTFRLHNG